MLDVLVVGGIFREFLGHGDKAEPENRLAGSGLTAAVAASRLGASVALASFVGSEDADNALSLLEHASVEPFLVVLDGASGIFAYEDAGADKARPQFRPAETCPTSLPSLPPARIVLVFGVPDFDPVRDDSVRAASVAAKELVWDRQGWISRTRDATAALALGAPNRLLLINAGEAIDEGILDARTGSVHLPAGYRRGLVKDGPHGILAIEASETSCQTLIPVYPVDVASTVGSGDLFAGVVAARLAAGDDLPRVAQYAAAATSVVLSTGDVFAPPDLNELVQTRLKAPSAISWRWAHAS